MASLEEAIYSALANDETLSGLVTGVYNTIALQSTTYPFIIFQLISAEDDYTLTQRVREVYRYQVRCVAEGYDNETCVAAMRKVDALLTGASLSVSSYTFWYARRSRQFAYAETDFAGKAYQTVGAEWIIEMDPT